MIFDNYSPDGGVVEVKSIHLKPHTMKNCIMKILLCVAVLTIIQENTFAQSSDSTLPSNIYFGFGGGGGYDGGIFETNFTLIYDKKWGGSLVYTLSAVQPDELPDDYVEGICLFGNCEPRDHLKMVSLKVLRVFKDNKEKFEYEAALGPSYVFFNIAHFEYDPDNGFSANYDIEYTSHSTAGLAASLNLKFMTARWLGIQISPYAYLNTLQSMIGAEVKFLIGKVRSN